MPLFVVTGANGFIGTNVVERLLTAAPEELGFAKEQSVRFSDFENKVQEKGCSVIATDMSNSMNRINASRFLGSVRYHYVDYENLIAHLNKLDRKPDMVIHNGACSSTTETNPEIFQKLNLGYSQLLWEYCAKNDIPFIYASSAATYGDGRYGFSDKKEDCEKYVSLNLYGKSKLDFDLWALKQKTTPQTWFGLRYFNVFGQFESHKAGQASMVFHGYNQAVRTGKIKLFESNSVDYAHGEQLRDFVYIDDITDITMELIRICMERKENKSSHIIADDGLFLNIGRGIAESWNNLAREVFSALSLPESIEYISMPDNIVRQYQNYTCAELSTLRSLGIQHEFRSLKTGVTKYVQKHLMRGQ